MDLMDISVSSEHRPIYVTCKHKNEEIEVWPRTSYVSINGIPLWTEGSSNWN